MVAAVLALNRVYRPHRQLKWQRQLLGGLPLVPERLGERLRALSSGTFPDAFAAAGASASDSAAAFAGAFAAAEALLADTVALVSANSSRADIGAFREALSERRRPVDPPASWV